MTTKTTRQTLVKKIKRVVLKLGSYVLTTPSWRLDRKVFCDVVDSIVSLRTSGTEFLIVSSGAIAAGMGALKLKERPRHISIEQAAAAVGQISLMDLYGRLFKKHGVPVAQILLTHGDLRDRKRFLNARQTLNSVLSFRAVPIINENDSTVVEEIKFGDNDHLSSLVTNLAQADLLIILTDTDGLYDKDPRVFPDAQLIERIEGVDKRIEKLALGTKRTIARGGMATKIKAAKTAALFGVPTIIANGKTPGTLRRIFAGDNIGSLILPETNKLTSRKHWIACTLQPQGVLFVDNGAKIAMLEKNRSLLPSGITGVKGTFDAGEAVICCDQQHREFARGLTAYSSADIEKIKGLQSLHINHVLGISSNPEVIHRDDMVLVREN